MNRTTLNYKSASDNRTPSIKVPKKLLTSKVWKSRNDSSNLNAILHPETYNETPRMKYNEKIKGNVTRKFCLGSNRCYCREKCNIPRPSLIPKPTTCVKKSAMGKKISIEDLKRSSLNCVCSGKSQDNKEGSLRDRLLKIKQGKIHQDDVELGFTKQRLDYEQYREEHEVKYLQEIENYRHQEELEKKEGLNENNYLENENFPDDDEKQRRVLDDEGIGTDAEVRTLLGTRTYETRSSTVPTRTYETRSSTVPTTYSQSSKDRYSSIKNTRNNSSKFTSDLENYYLPENHQSKYLKNPNFFESSSDYSRSQKSKASRDISETVSNDLSKFRSEHFFETHDIGRMGQHIEEHTCIHQFILDHRMLPEPLNQDGFGKSLCKICQKPMEESSNIDKRYFGPTFEPTSTNIRNLAKCAKYGLSPKPVYIGTGKEKIELVFGKNDLNAFGNVVKKLKKTEYCNSLALRQQKMRLV